jgi:hypothetical protein
MESPNSPLQKKPRQVKSKVKRKLIIFFGIKVSVHKEFVLTGQTVNSAYDCDVLGYCMNMCEHFTPNSGDKRIGCCIKTTHRLILPSSPGNFLTKNMTFTPHTPYFSLSPIEDKTGRSPYGHNEVIKAELYAVLNTLTEYDFQDELKKIAEELGTVHTGGVMAASRPKITF